MTNGSSTASAAPDPVASGITTPIAITAIRSRRRAEQRMMGLPDRLPLTFPGSPARKLRHAFGGGGPAGAPRAMQLGDAQHGPRGRPDHGQERGHDTRIELRACAP